MTFSILELENGNRSLEFDETDLPVLEAFLHSNFKDMEIQKRIIHSDIVLADTRLMFYNDWWGDPCLISLDEKGALLLDSIFIRLSAGEK
ncbi:hypothetical protein OIU34_15980 [Pararhizobium sp. BT-229]|uniref:hypothetical protein n=1 Tax=Pararhizobium sp. BT-229 TaxID=2986923 RepID=UPI0021F706D7|nr:hypothetical protein [Pararhizobium sp. BT-229]MCV9963403.1 hypothetical protein [Pararhizobium sp. BT-229]